MDLILLKTFLKVASLGSITKAAAVLFVTQSAVSRRIKQLEGYLGQPLLERCGPSLSPTDAGRLLMEKGRKILEMEQQILESLGARSGRQRVSFCCTPSLGIDRLTAVTSKFMSDYSDSVELSCVFTMPEDALQGIDSGRFDLALLDHCDTIDFHRYLSHPFPDDEVLFISSAASGLGDEVPLEALLGRRLYLKKENGCAKRFLDMNMHSLGHSTGDFSRVVYYDDCPFIVREVLAGRGITFASTGIVASELRDGSLRAHRVTGFNHWRPRTLVLAPQDPSQVILALLDTIFATFGVTPPQAPFQITPAAKTSLRR